MIDCVAFEHLFTGIQRARLSSHAGYHALLTIPGIVPALAALFVAEIGYVDQFPGPAQLAWWAGLIPQHHESDAHVHRGRITKQGSRLVRWAAVESVQIVGKSTAIGAFRDRVAATRGRNISVVISVVAAARKQLGYVYYALREHHVRALQHHQPNACVA